MFNLGSIAIAIMAFIGVFVAFVTRHDAKVVASVTNKIEANNAAVTRKAATAAAKSADPATPGVRLPYRDDKR